MTKVQPTDRSELLMRCIPMLRTQVQLLFDDADAAHEVVQEVILTMLSTPNCPDDMPRFAALCREVVEEIAIRYRGGAEFGASVPWDEELASSPNPWTDPEHAVDTREELAHAVDPLGDEALELLVRRYVLGENANEIARGSDRSPAALRVRLMRLRCAARGHCPDHRSS